VTIVLLRRLAFVVFVLWGVTAATFFLARVAPADPARLLAGPRASEQAVEQVRQANGLDQPITEQYWSYVTGLVQGDLGESLVTRQPVLEDLGRLFPATLELVLYSLILGTIMGVAIGAVSAVRRGTAVDALGRLVAIGGLSVPAFWIAMLLQLTLYGALGILPFGGRLDTGVVAPPSMTGLYTIDSLLAGRFDLFVESVQHLILPVFTLALAELGLMARIVRTSMLEVLGRDYIRTARAKGLKERRVYWRHALRNALLPPVTILGLELGLLLTGSVLIESVFAWPGIGRYAADAIAAADYNAIMGVTIVVAVVYVAANVVIDLLYLALDPRVRMS
jgi:peptide/nickel transport system permease protein